MRKIAAVVTILLLVASLGTLGWAGYVFGIPTYDAARTNAHRNSERTSKDTSQLAILAAQIRALRTDFLTEAGGVENSMLTQQAQQRARNHDWLVDSLTEHGDGYRSRRTLLHTGLGTADKALVTVEEYTLERAETAVRDGMVWITPQQARGGVIGVYATWFGDKIYCVSIIAAAGKEN